MRQLFRFTIGQLLLIMALVGMLIVMGTAVWRRTTGGYQPEAVSYSPDGSLLAVQTSDGRVRSWNTETGKMHSMFDIERAWFRWKQHQTFELIDNQHLLKGNQNGQFIILDVKDGTQKAQFSQAGTLPFGIPLQINADISGNGERVAKVTIGGQPGVEIYKTHTGELIRRITGRIGTPQAVALDHEGRRLAVFRATGEVQLWDVESGQMLSQWRGPPLDALGSPAIDLSPGGRYVARSTFQELNADEANEDEVENVDEEGGDQPPDDGELPEDPADDPANPFGDNPFDVDLGPADPRNGNDVFSEPDGSILGQEQVEILDIVTGEQKAALDVTESHAHLRFSPDGSQLAMIEEDGDVRIVETLTGEEIGVIEARSSPQHALLDYGILIDTVQYSPDGKTIAVGRFGELVLYDTQTLKPVRVLWRDRAGWQGYIYAFALIGWGIAWGLVTGHRQRQDRLAAIEQAEEAAPRLDPWREGVEQAAGSEASAALVANSPTDDVPRVVADLPETPPGKLRAIWYMMGFGGLLAVVWGVFVVFGVGSCASFLPTAWAGMLIGAFSIARGAGRCVEGLNRIAVFQALSLFAGDPVNFILGLISIIFLRDGRVHRYLRPVESA